jgi:hypothetical protein
VGGDADPDQHLRIEVRTPQGALKAARNLTTNAFGSFFTGCIQGLRVRGRDTVSASSDGSLLRLFAIPRFAFRLDRVADRAIGRGPADADLSLVLDRCVPAGITCYGGALEQTIHTGDGTGEYDLALKDDGQSNQYDAIGGERVKLRWEDGDGNTVQRYEWVPFLRATLGAASVGGAASPGTSHSLTLRSSNATLRGGAPATATLPDGQWSATLKKDGSPVKVRIGDRLRGTIAADALLTARSISVHMDLGTDSVSGSCYPNGMVGVRFREPGGGGGSAYAYGTAGSTGSFDSIDGTGLDAVDHGWLVTLSCADVRGDILRKSGVVP